MKRFFAVVVILLLAACGGAWAAGPDDQYVQLFNLIQEADSLRAAQPAQALAKYRDAQTALLKFQKENPNWSPSIVSFRLDYLATTISALSGNVPPAAVAPPPPVVAQPGEATQKPAPTAPAQPAKPAVPEDWQNQVNGLKDQVRQLEADKSLLEAKLKEAFSARPAESDPRELARAEQTIKTLQKENDLLKVAVEGQKGKTAPPADNKSLEQAQQALTAANQQLASQQEMVSRLTLEKQALESRVKQLSANAAPSQASAPAENPSQLKQLQRDRDRLQKELDAANSKLASRKGKAPAADTQQLQGEVTALRARLEVLEARAVPYTAEELALFKKPEPKLPEAPPKTSEKPISELSPSMAILVNQARRYFQAGDFDKAETSYGEVVRQDPKNVPVLTDLASIQVEANHLDAAEKNIKQALALAPDSAYALSVLGRLRFRQGKFDEAIDALSRAAKLEPTNAEVENFLGLALSEKGLRGPAEAALRKALELDSNYAIAHENLAVVYATGQPPSIELARWHYQRALAAGAPHNPKLEKLLEAKQ